MEKVAKKNHTIKKNDDSLVLFYVTVTVTYIIVMLLL
jgi:hypothetical protein